MNSEGQPRVRRNEWRALEPPALGGWTPTLSVSVVIPAHNAHATLPLTLAALAQQSYPQDLLEVVVVDDGSEPALELPELRPGRTRLVRTEASWGPGHACAVGIDASGGEVILRLDADMIVYRDHVEAQMRWHHLIDYAVVQGHKSFIDPRERSGGLPTPVEVAEATAVGNAAGLFADQDAMRHEWVEAMYDRTDDLNQAGPTAWTVHVGATGSMPVALYRLAGGMDPTLKLGEDTELGYRLSQVGAVFIPDREAKSWHVGPSTAMQRAQEVVRHNWPYLTDRIPQLRYRRTSPGRQYSVPYLHAVVEATSADWEKAQRTIDGLLASLDVEVIVSCVGPWSSLDDRRRSVLSDPLRELRMIAGTYAGDGRVRLVDEAPRNAFPASFLLHLPVGWCPATVSLAPLLKRMEAEELGLVSILMPDGATARVERTAAGARVDRLIRQDEERNDVLEEVYGVWWSDGPDLGFRWWEDVSPARGSTVAVAELQKELAAAKARIAAFKAAEEKSNGVASAARSVPRRGWRFLPVLAKAVKVRS